MNDPAEAKVRTATPLDASSHSHSERIDSSSSTTYAVGCSVIGQPLRRLAQGRLAREGQREREAGALSRPARHPQAPARMLDDAPADIEAEAAALGLGGERVAGLA